MDQGLQDHLNRARALLGDEEAPQGPWHANEAINHALRIQLDHAGAWTLKSQALSALHDDPAALAAAERATRLAPQSAAAHFVLATVLIDLERHDEALSALAASEALCRAQDPLHEDITYERANLLAELGDNDGALAAFEQGLRRFPDSELLRAGVEPLRRHRLRHRLRVIDGGLQPG